MGGLLLYAALAACNLYVIATRIGTMWWLLIPSALLAWVLADFVSGLVHWAGDTLGNPNIPILGPGIIRPFREHHLDQKAICHHDMIETNAASAFAGIPILALCLLMTHALPGAFFLFAASVMVLLCLFSSFTNQIHKWAHADAPPKWVVQLQEWRIFLNPVHHKKHHTFPFNNHYCITNGWLNDFLCKVSFFRHLEKALGHTGKPTE